MTELERTTTGVPLHTAGDHTATRAVIVIHEAFGVTDHIKDVTERFAQAGYVAVAPELFHRHGGPVFDYDDLDGARAVTAKLDADQIDMDLRATVSHLHALGVPRGAVGLVGYCLGGTVALAAAANGLVDAAVTFYGGGIQEGRFGYPALVDLAEDLTVPWLGLFGDEDRAIPVGDVELLRAAAADADVFTEVVRYPGVGHAFHNDARPEMFDAEAAADAASRTLAFFDTHLTNA